MKNKLKIILKTILILIISSIIGFILLFISYNIPNNKVKNNIKDFIIKDSDMFPKEITNINNTIIDYYIESIMLTEIIVDGEDKLDLAASNYYFNERNPLDGLTNYLNNRELSKYNYSRYWHGYSLPLKILLSIFNLSEVKIINYYFQMLLIILICLELKNKKLQKYILPFLISIFFMMPMVIYKCLPYSLTYNLTLISSLFIIKYSNKINKNINYVFLLIGILTSYNDLLTTPLLTLCYPLLIYLLISKLSTKEKIKKVFILSIFWAIGYLGMWFLKWIISSIILHKNILSEAYDTILFRMSKTDLKGNNTKLLDPLFSNIKIFSEGINIILLMLIFILFLIVIIRLLLDKYNKLDSYEEIIPYVIVFCFPIIWYIVISNHSLIHSKFTYRILSISLFSICIMVIKFNQLLKK